MDSISNLEKELSIIDEEIGNSRCIIKFLEDNFEKAKKEYLTTYYRKEELNDIIIKLTALLDKEERILETFKALKENLINELKERY